MAEDSALSWIMLTILVYGSAIYIIVKGFLEKERYKRENDRF